jgi:hypothetical protein
MPAVVTHRYHPALGPCLNLCSLPGCEAASVLDRLRHDFRPTLKPGYLDRRHRTEAWLAEAASSVLDRTFQQRPAYFFLGDFSWLADPSRPAALVTPLSTLPPHAITFTLGDSMSVADDPARRLYTLEEMKRLFAEGAPVTGFAFSDQPGRQARFIEIQLWDTSSLRIHMSQGSETVKPHSRGSLPV